MPTLPFLSLGMTPIIASGLLIFAIVFGLLEYVTLFKNKGVNALIAIVVGVFSAAYAPFVSAMQQYIPFAALIFIPLFFVAFIRKMFEKKKDEEFDVLSAVITLATLLGVVGIFWDEIARLLPGGIDPSNVLWIVGLVIIFAIFYFVQKYEWKEEKNP